jgi:hypothetical protein
MKPDLKTRNFNFLYSCTVIVLALMFFLAGGCAKVIESRITVVTDPPNADVFSDDLFVGVSPCLSFSVSRLFSRFNLATSRAIGLTFWAFFPILR